MSEQYNYYEHYTLDANFVQDDTKYPDRDIALVPGKIIVNPTDPMFADELQHQRTSAMIARTPKGRIFISYFSGSHADENVGNYIMVISSDDDGKTFQNRIAILAPDPSKAHKFKVQIARGGWKSKRYCIKSTL